MYTIQILALPSCFFASSTLHCVQNAPRFQPVLEVADVRQCRRHEGVVKVGIKSETCTTDVSILDCYSNTYCTLVMLDNLARSRFLRPSKVSPAPWPHGVIYRSSKIQLSLKLTTRHIHPSAASEADAKVATLGSKYSSSSHRHGSWTAALRRA